MSETELVERLERLERAYRRLKGFAIAALGLSTALATIYATQPVPNVITAHEFDAVDNSGKARVAIGMVSRAMGLPPSAPGVYLYDTQAEQRMSMSVDASGEPQISLLDMKGSVLLLPLSIGFADFAGGRAFASMGVSAIVLGGAKGKAFARMGVSHLMLSDAQGFRMDLGSTQTATPATGATQQTSAASIVMFGNDKEHRAIWKAP